MLKQIFAWLNITYFSGSYSIAYELTSVLPWAEIRSRFLTESSENKHLLIGVDEDAIVISNEEDTHLKRPANTVITLGELTISQDGVLLTVSVDAGGYLRIFLGIWKGIIFAISVLVITLTVITIVGNGLTNNNWFSLLPIVLFNIICIGATSAFKYKAIQMLNYVESVIAPIA